MIHYDLFSGIGGFAYAVDQVWENVEHIFCEINPFCQAVLKKHWEGSDSNKTVRNRRDYAVEKTRNGNKTGLKLQPKVAVEIMKALKPRAE